MSRTTTTQRAYAMLVIVMLLWAGNVIVGRAVRYDIPPFMLAFVRWTGALCIVIPLAAKHLRADLPALKANWGMVLTFGLVGIAAFNGFLYSGLRLTPATNALLLQASIPALVLVFDLLLFRARPALWQIIGVAVSTLGVGVVITRGDFSVLATLRFGLGDIMVLCAVLCWSLYTALLKLRPSVQQISFLAVTFAIGAIAMAPMAALEWREVARMTWPLDLIAGVVYVAVLPSVVAYGLFNYAVAQIGPSKAGQAISLMPLFGAGLAALLLKEPLHAYHLTGMVLILGGIAITAFMGRNAAGAPT